MKPLVLYYSRTGSTKLVAEFMAEALKADIERIVELKDRSGTKGYVVAGKDAWLKKASDIKPLKADIKDHDLVMIGQPVWMYTMIPPIRGLLKKYDFKKKRVGLFCTMDGSGDKKLFSETIKGLLGSEIVGRGTFIKPKKNPDAAKSQVKDFLKEAKLL